MSFKRVVLMVILAFLWVPAAALADGVNFGFGSGQMNAGGAALTNTIAGGGLPSTLALVIRAPNPPGPSFGSIGSNLGTVQMTTGTAFGATATQVFFGSGGAVIVTSNSNFATLTGGAVPAATTLFSGSFTGTTTWTQLTFPTPACSANPTCLNSFNFSFSLLGPVAGTINPALISFLNLGTSTGGSGFLFTLTMSFIGPSAITGSIETGHISLTVPEPGTLALFGTGLVGLAGLLRRKLIS